MVGGMDEKTRALIEWIAKNARRESGFLYPNPSRNVNAHALLDEIVRLHGLDPDEVDQVLVSAQLAT
jgi:hypothetical protein